ncbi:helix-turn-helix domain-containing protein [Winogradskyella pulchriflava]|uniref:Helix-turn-helix domain-containing protein n=1 Tax=Winogradskyella pulchriflava TaxID=1110688 RepID=A0ABV6Q7C4_9FLAO
MRHVFALPSDPLKSYIDYYFIFENSTNNPLGVVDVFPSSNPSMVFTYGNKDIWECFDKGQKQKPSSDFALDTYVLKKRKFIGNNDFGIIVVCFKPWGIHNFIPLHIKEEAGQRILLKDLYSAKIEPLEDKLLYANNDAERLIAIESFLISILKNVPIDQRMQYACNIIKNSVGMEKIYDIAKSVDLSEKQFNRNFIETMGISPKLYSRLERFYFTIKRMKTEYDSLTQIALNAGYFDQSHFIREFKNFTQTTPLACQKNTKNTFFGHPLNF